MEKQKETYEDILARARRLNLTEAKGLGVMRLPDLRDAHGRPVVVMSPGVVDTRRLQDAEFVDRLKCYLLLSLDAVSKQEYTVALFSTKMKFSIKLFQFLFKEVYSILPRPYKKNIKALFVLHAPDLAKAFFRMVLFMVSRKFWKKVHYLPSLAALSDALEVPEPAVSASVPRFIVAHEQRWAEKLAQQTSHYRQHPHDYRDHSKDDDAHGGVGGGVAVASPAPESPGAVFGQPLGALKCNQYGVPTFLLEVESLLQQHALGQEGLFRVPPPQDDLVQAQAQLDAGNTPAFFTTQRMEPEEVNIIGTLYKLFFRRLPEPLIPFVHYDAVMRAQSTRDPEKVLSALEIAITTMPREHRNTLLHLIQFLALVAVQSHSNKMGMSNLALIFAPSILRSSNLDPMLELSSIKARVDAVRVLFENLDRLEQLEVYAAVRRPPLPASSAE